MISNVLGLLAALGIAVSAGGILGPWFGLLAGSLELAAVAYAVHVNIEVPEEAPAARPGSRHDIIPIRRKRAA